MNTSIHRLYQVNDSFLDIDSHEKYWLIGFLASDGGIGRHNQIIIGQSGREGLKRLEYIKRLIESESPITKRKTSAQDAYRLQISSAQMVKQLGKYNVVRNKTLTYTLPEIPIEYVGSFIAGYVEGDGCITISHNNYNTEYLSVSFVGTKDFICSCNEIIPIKGSVRKHSRSTIYEVRWYGKMAVAFCDWLYAYPKLYHGVKYNNYLQGKAIVMNSRHSRYLRIKEQVFKDLSSGDISIIPYAKGIGIPFQTIYKWRAEWIKEGKI